LWTCGATLGSPAPDLVCFEINGGSKLPGAKAVASHRTRVPGMGMN
jgi:hypothetical protein